MRGRLAGWAVYALALSALLLLCAPAQAQQQERRIEAAAKEAIRRAHADFSAADYDTGLARLLKASHACGTIRCSPPTRAALLRDAGVMQLRRGSAAKAAQLFGEAVRVDARIELPEVYDSPDIRRAWSAAKGEEAPVAAERPPPAGDFTHVPAPEQAERTPLPIYVEYTGSDAVASVVAKYRAPGDGEWKRLSLVHVGRGFGGTVPCGDVRLGALRYYVQGFDAGGSPNAVSGDPKHPYVVAIRQTIAGPPPSLPGQPPPATCAPGEAETPIPAEEEGKRPQACEDDSQCNGGTCQGGHCVSSESNAGSTGYARFWIGASLSGDVTVLPGQNDVCKLSSDALPTAGYVCTNPDGSDFPTHATTAENDSLAPGNAGQAGGGLKWGNVRVLASFDFAATPNILLGARFGYVAGGYTASAAAADKRAFGPPIQLEARATYVFGQNALTHSGFSPTAFVDGGIAKFDAGTTVTVTESGVPGHLTKTAWHTGGPGFLGAGGGVRYQFSQRIAFTAAFKVGAAFGGNGVFGTFGPEVALQYGL